MPSPLPLTILPILGLSVAGVATADVPAVVTDIAPVHSLAAIVMDGVGAPDLLVEPGASPHGYALRPSQARALDAADVVFWIGEGLEPWLVGPIDTLASDAHVIELGESEGSLALPFRTGATFDAHDHEDDHAEETAHGDDDHDEHEHDDAQGTEDHAEHDHGEHDDGEHDHDHDEHAHAKTDHDHGEEDHAAAHDTHDHQGQDPHAWLDPENARAWLQVIATELAEIDPANAETYRANAEAGRVELAALIEEVSAGLAPVRGRPFIVFHDAYQYFENRFDISAQGAISLGDASDPSPARIADVRGKVLALDAHCAFAEPQHNPDLIATVFEGVEARTGTLDPLGADLAPGAALYPQLIRNLATAFTECLR